MGAAEPEGCGEPRPLYFFVTRGSFARVSVQTLQVFPKPIERGPDALRRFWRVLRGW